MTRNTRITARFSPEEQTLLIHVAARLRRTKSDTLRILLYEKAVELGLDPDFLPSYYLENQVKQS